MSDFEQAVNESAQKALLKMISDGSWIAPDYANRFKIPAEMLSQIWGMIDTEALKKKMAERIEQELADRIVNHMAAELASDIKQLLSVKERREEIRSVARQHLSHLITGDNA